MRRIWIIIPLVLMCAIGVIGYIGYRAIKNTITIPEDLRPYESSATAMALIKSKAPAPSPDEHLTERQVDLFITMLDSINIGADQLRPAIDKLEMDTLKHGRVRPNVLAVPGVVHQALIAGALTRRAIVNYLNDKGLSWEQYLWIKEHVLAASGITPQEADSSSVLNLPMSEEFIGAKLKKLDSLKARDRQMIPLRISRKSGDRASKADRKDGGDDDDIAGDDSTGNDFEVADLNSFDYLNELRTRVVADSSEVALVAPRRALLLRRALSCMRGRDKEF